VLLAVLSSTSVFVYVAHVRLAFLFLVVCVVVVVLLDVRRPRRPHCVFGNLSFLSFSDVDAGVRLSCLVHYGTLPLFRISTNTSVGQPLFPFQVYVAPMGNALFLI
jgi:hypothetical protein